MVRNTLTFLAAALVSFPVFAQSEEQLISRYTAFAGSKENATSLVNGLRDKSEVKLTSAQGSETFTPSTAKMGYGNIDTALALAEKMGLQRVQVVHMKGMGSDYTFFVVYGRVNHLVDTSKVQVVERDYPLLTPKEVNAAVKRTLRRRLVVVPRETPYSIVHLDNMLKLASAGAVVLPASPGFYHRPIEISDLIDFIVARVLDQFHLPHSIGKRWGSQ